MWTYSRDRREEEMTSSALYFRVHPTNFKEGVVGSWKVLDLARRVLPVRPE